MSKQDEVQQLLSDVGAVLIRSRKHEIWRLPNGHNFVKAQTTSDRNSHANNLSDLRKMLGMTPEHKEGVRREKKRTNGKPIQRHYTQTVNTDLADKLQLAGVSTLAYQERIEFLEGRIADLTEDLTLTVEIAERAHNRADKAERDAQTPKCWFCKLKLWVNR